MIRIFGQKTLEERKFALVSQIKQLKNESIKLNAQIRFFELALKEGLSPAQPKLIFNVVDQMKIRNEEDKKEVNQNNGKGRESEARHDNIQI